MKTIVHTAKDRGFFDHGWLQTHHSFSFGDYYDPAKMHFGRLRVLNDDVVAPGRGFGTHPHENMEIVTIPLAGALAHKDSTGHEEVIRPNDVQVMSAGTGIWHSEYNHSQEKQAEFLQVWVIPDQKSHTPRYDQKTFDPAERDNQFQTLVSPDKEGLWLHQNAWFSRVTIDADQALEYRVHADANGVYLFVIDGQIKIDQLQVGKRDALGISAISQFPIHADSNADVLAIEVPMN